MKTNEANWDRIARIVVGGAVLSLAFVGPATPWAFLGLIPLVTGVVGWCPAYRIFGVSTCPMKRGDA
ncbi:MAG: DUF2892 domain-containing protein [Myxococcota bacterium]